MTTQTKLEQLRQIQELEQQLKLKITLKMQRKQRKHSAARELTEQLQKELKVSRANLHLQTELLLRSCPLLKYNTIPCHAKLNFCPVLEG